jgi:hypothetical protein
VKKLAWLLAVATFVSALVYSVISLNRWEWSRALFFGLVVVIAEIGLATGLVMHKLDRMASAERSSGDVDEIRGVLRRTRPRKRRFAWLEPEEVVSRSNVFITMLVGGGVVLSALAWVLDKVAATTTTSLQEGRLAGDLSRIAYPEDGLLVDDVTVLAQSVPHVDAPQLRALLRRGDR